MLLSQSEFSSKFRKQRTLTSFTEYNMNKILFLLAIGLALPPLCSIAAVPETNTWLLASPNKQCEISISLDQGRLNFRASRDGKLVIKRSPLGLLRDDQNFEN